MRNIAIFQRDLNIGGIEKSCVNLINNFDYKKYNVDLYLFSKDNIYLKDLNKNVNVFYLNPLPYITKLVPFRILKKFYRPHVNKAYDIAIDFNSYANETAIATIQTKAMRRFMWIHNDVKIKIREEVLYRILHFLFKSKYSYFDTFVGVSKPVLNTFLAVNKIKGKTTYVIPNIIDTKKIFAKAKEDSPLTVDKEAINVVSVARIVHQKGFDLLVDEINALKDRLKNVHFYFIGDGDLFKKIQAKINDCGLNDLITMVGFLANPYSLMQEADAFILLSRYEGQGMAFLEAKALGLEVIMPKHLEVYVDGYIEGTEDIGEKLLSLKKRKKKVNPLLEYNEKIIEQINNL